MSKKILLSIITIALVAGLAAAGTYAYYTASVGSSGNEYLARTFRLTIDPGGNATSIPAQFADVYPGWTSTASMFSLYGDPNLPGNLSLTVANLSGRPLADKINVTIRVMDDLGNQIGMPVYQGTLSGVFDTGVALGSIAAGGHKNLKIDYGVSTSAGNEIQGMDCWFDQAFTLTQTAP